MSLMISLTIFVIILFIYIHMIDQFKKSNDLELYEMDYTNNNDLNETCNIKQPIVFYLKNVNEEFFDSINIEYLDKIQDNILITDEKREQFVLNFSSASLLLQNDKKHKFYTEDNESFVYDTNLQNLYESNDAFLKPYFTVHTKYDLHFASNECTTPLKYHTFQRKFFCVHSGKVRIKLIPPKYSTYLHEIKDYDKLEFYSPINIWDIQKEYIHLIEKTQQLEFDVQPGNVIFIPPYWWYSVKYIYDDDTPSLASSITYITGMNALANAKNYLLYFVQQSNTKVVKTKTITQEELKEQLDENNEDEKDDQDDTNTQTLKTDI